MDEYVLLYPHLSAKNRIVHKELAIYGTTPFKTYLRYEFSTYSPQSLKLYLDYVKKLISENENLVLITMTHTVRYYGYKKLKETKETAQKEKFLGV